jgi:hypothetical protein
MLLTPEEMPAVALKDKPRGSLVSRAWQMIRHNPGMLHSVLREEYRRRWGISLDRRYRQGKSGPPVSLNLDLTRRCNLSVDVWRTRIILLCRLGWYDRPGTAGGRLARFADQVAYFRPGFLTGGSRCFPPFRSLSGRPRTEVSPPQRHSAGPGV